ncbi:MAG: hypothetical protein ABT24_12610 [Thiomonas sp. SCN 64-16]|jgi:hypothetical protein|nr:MAG: hypothetical protein ABT24_12610 [Thiomonas sp. SCN 64-16]CQR44832.1 conserved hypothetical protein [Thiomonas sp. CB3]
MRIMKTVGHRNPHPITLHARAGALEEFGRFNDAVHSLGRTRILLPKGVFRLSHEEADRQKTEGIARGMALLAADRDQGASGATRQGQK